MLLIKQACKSLEDTQVAGYARFEKASVRPYRAPIFVQALLHSSLQLQAKLVQKHSNFVLDANVALGIYHLDKDDLTIVLLG